MNSIDRRAKIIATIGPSTSDSETIAQLIEAGSNLFRLNFSHGDHATHANSLNLIRQASLKCGKEVAVIADLQGPKIRLTALDHEVTVIKNQKIIISANRENKAENVVTTSYANFAKDVKAGERILIDDGLIELVAEEVLNDFDVSCLVIFGGQLKDRKGINLPETKLSIPSFTEKDLADLKFIATTDIDFIALSFIRSAKDLILFKEKMSELGIAKPLIAKIEKPEALTNIKEIIDHCYAVMVARGDLGVEIAAEQVPFEQKRIVKLCNKIGRPVIIATQMLESMITKAVPTRAEANDVANAVLDGADCLMLSAETATGLNPVRCVMTMAKIISNAENNFMHDHKSFIKLSPNRSSSDALCYSAVHLAIEMKSKYLSCITLYGNTALKLAKHRPPMQVLAFTDSVATQRLLVLSWGIKAVLMDKIAGSKPSLDLVVQAIDDSPELNKDDVVILVAGLPEFTSDTTNTIKVVIIKKAKASFM